MVYKLYKDRSKSTTPKGPELFEEFNKIYQEQDVKVIGVWQNTDDLQEYYFMTTFRDEMHYNQFIENMKTNTKYQELSTELGKDRESIEVITLRDAVSS